MSFVIPGLTRNPVFFWIPAFADILNGYLILHLKYMVSNSAGKLYSINLICQINYGNNSDRVIFG